LSTRSPATPEKSRRENRNKKSRDFFIKYNSMDHSLGLNSGTVENDRMIVPLEGERSRDTPGKNIGGQNYSSNNR
jgi:hypothetical protein